MAPELRQLADELIIRQDTHAVLTDPEYTLDEDLATVESWLKEVS